MVQGLKSHPLAKLFPDLPRADFAALVENIREHGVKLPVLIYRGQILDGRQRYRACQKLNRPCPTVIWNGKDPWLEIQSRNLVRRHLAKDQIYAICKLAAQRFPEIAAPIRAVKAEAKGRQARKPRGKRDPQGTRSVFRSRGRNKEAAELIGVQIGVSGTTVKRVDRLAREAPELVLKVAAGEISVKTALRQVARRNDTVAATEPRTYAIDADLRRLENSIMASWNKCPIEQRTRLLRGLQILVRDLIAEYHSMRSPPPTERNPFDRHQTVKAS